MSDSATLIQKLWSYCDVLRDDGLSYQDYIEQLTFLLFLKMADEQTKPPFNRPVHRTEAVRTGESWSSRDGDDLEAQYRHVPCRTRATSRGPSASSSSEAQNRIQDPAKLKRLIVRPDRAGELDVAATPT